MSSAFARIYPSVRRAAAFLGSRTPSSRSSTLNMLCNHGGNQDYCGIIWCTPRAFNGVCGETSPGPGTLAVYLQAKTPAASSPKKHLPPPNKNSVCLSSQRCGSADVKGWPERDGERPTGQSGEVHPQGVGRLRLGRRGAREGFNEKVFWWDASLEGGCRTHRYLAMILDRQSQSLPREA